MPASSVSEPCVGHPRHGFNTGYLVLTVFSRRAVPYIYMLSSQLVLTADTDLALHVIGSVLVMQIIKIANLPITAIYTIHAEMYLCVATIVGGMIIFTSMQPAVSNSANIR
jgi:hypothetical protein